MTIASLAQHSTVKSPSKLSGGETARRLDEPEKAMLPQLWPPTTDEVNVAVRDEVRVAVDDDEPVIDSDSVVDEVDDSAEVAVLVTVVVLVAVDVGEAEDDAAVQARSSKMTH